MLNKTLLSYKTKGYLKKNRAPRSSMSYNGVKNIGVIFSIDTREKHEVIKGFIKQLEDDGKTVEVLAFLPNKKENHEFLFDFFTQKEVSFWGNFHSEKVENFAQKSFDYLFYIDNESNLLIKNILAMSKAKCRIAPFDEANEQYSEMMVQVPSSGDIQQLIDEMYRYTKLLS